MRDDTGRVILCECDGRGREYADEAVLYFCEYFDRHVMLYSVTPDAVMVLTGDKDAYPDVPLKHKEDVITYEAYEKEKRSRPEMKEMFKIYPYVDEDGALDCLSDHLYPILVSGRWEKALSYIREHNCGLYYNDFYEFEGAADYLLEKSGK